MEKLIFQVWNVNRDIKKTFMSTPNIDAVMDKAKIYGLSGVKLILESNGSEICEDEVLEYFARERNIFILLKENEEWMPAGSILNLSSIINGTLEDENQNIGLRSTSSALEKDDILLENPTLSDTTTLTMTSTALSSSSSVNSESRTLFCNFKIPWQKMPPDVMALLKEQKSLGKRMNALANIVVDEMRQISFFIPMGILRNVAQQIAAKYPDSVLLKDKDGHTLSSTPIALITAMKNRNNFLNRAPHKRRSQFDPHIPIKERRKTNILQQTCINWQTQQITSTETTNSLEYKKRYLQEMYVTETIATEDLKTVEQYMADCYPIQRLFFNNRENIPSIKDIQDNWPYIFNKTCSFTHFKKLLEIDPKVFYDNFQEQKGRIFKFFKLSRRQEIIKTLKSESDMDLLKAIIKYFKEDESFLIKTFKFGTTFDEITGQIPAYTPWVAVVENELNKDIVYVFIEKILVQKMNHINIAEILAQIICYYYIFNLLYPKQLCQTFEFLVRFFFKYHNENIRGQKKHINNISKIVNLIKKLNDFNE